jgi:hypothetical protein
MFIVRVDFRNGLHLEFNYGDLGQADQCLKLLVEAQKSGKPCSIFDEAGRQGTLSGADMQAVQMVDVEQETTSVIRLGLMVRGIQAQMEPRAPEFRPPSEDSSRGAIGNSGKTSFAA